MANRLVPTGCEYMPGQSSTARNTDCLICNEPLAQFPWILKHPACGNACCADDMIKCVRQYSNTCPVCRGNLGVLRPSTFDLGRERLYLATNGLDEVRDVVGEPFIQEPLYERMIGPARPISDIAQEAHPRNIHSAVVNLEEQYLLATEPILINGIPDVYLRTIEDRVRADAHYLADWQLHFWKDELGVRQVGEYMFPEYSPHTRFIVPQKPDIHVMLNLSALRKQMMTERARLLENHGADYPPGRWLHRKPCSTRELLNMLPNQNKRGLLQAVSISEHLRNLGFREVQWALWQSRNPLNERIYAVPRVEYVYHKESLLPIPTPGNELHVQGFTNDENHRHEISNQYLSNAGVSDPQLYDFGRRFEEVLEQRLFRYPLNGGDSAIDMDDEEFPRHWLNEDAEGRPVAPPRTVFLTVRADHVFRNPPLRAPGLTHLYAEAPDAPDNGVRGESSGDSTDMSTSVDDDDDEQGADAEVLSEDAEGEPDLDLFMDPAIGDQLSAEDEEAALILADAAPVPSSSTRSGPAARARDRARSRSPRATVEADYRRRSLAPEPESPDSVDRP